MVKAAGQSRLQNRSKFKRQVYFVSRNALEQMDPQSCLRVVRWLVEIGRPVKKRSAEGLSSPIPDPLVNLKSGKRSLDNPVDAKHVVLSQVT